MMNKNTDIQSLGLLIQEKEERLVQINEEFNKLIQASKYFEEYQKLDSETKEFRKEFDKAAIKFLKKTNQKTSEGPAGKITLAVRNSYKIKDPSFNNWYGLALAVRNNGVSDFPLCNKSHNLSYCGNDL